jgi:two-component system cell cycle response regulator
MARSTETVVTKISQQGEAAAAQADGGLVVFYGQNIGRRYFLNLPELIIGRSDAAAIQVDQESVSRQHVRVERTELRDGDLLGIGQTIFKYLSGSNIENKYHEEIYKLSTIDGLTETYNKRYFLNTLERELNRAYRYDRGLSLALFDIDHFKKINDSYGHLAGDQVLRELAALVNQNIRRQDILARYGGEEFAIILPEIDTPGSVMVCEKLRVLTDAHPFKFGKDSIHVTISCGIIAYTAPLGAIGNEAFIAEADAKLYAAKSGGRNQVRA